MLADLISASINQNDLTFVDKLPVSLMSPKEKEMVDWLKNYYKKHGTMPTKERFKISPYSLYWTDVLLATPLADLFGEATRKLQFEHITRVYQDIHEEYLSGKSLGIASLSQLSNELSSTETMACKSFSDFDVEDLIGKPGDYIPFGIDRIDEASGGIGLGEIALLFAPSGIGKSTYLIFLAVRAARKGYKVLFVTKETTDVWVMKRVYSILGNFDPYWFIKATYSKDYCQKIKDKAAFVKKQTGFYESIGGDIVTPRQGVYSALDIKTKINEEVQKTGRNFDLILIDGMHLMRPNALQGASSNGHTATAVDWRNVLAVSSDLLELSQRENYQTRILSTIQAEASISTRKAGGFEIKDIAFSKSVAQAASVVFALSKTDGVHHPITPKTRYIWAHMVKNRNGDDAGGVPVSEIKIDYNLMNFYCGSTNFKTDLSATPLGDELVKFNST